MRNKRREFKTWNDIMVERAGAGLFRGGSRVQSGSTGVRTYTTGELKKSFEKVLTR